MKTRMIMMMIKADQEQHQYLVFTEPKWRK